MNNDNEVAPARKAFISYSWSSPEHERWVLDLATELVQSGVDVVLDKWDLREGQDKYAFMEQMVTSPDVHKVLAVCDSKYAEKADGREGGVGTETQIMSKEVYDRVDQMKIVAVIAELDEDGRPCIPTFLRSRIYVDMSSPDLRAGNFEQLLRWVFDRPLYRKPPLGKAPRFITDDEAPASGTAAVFRRAMEAATSGRSNAAAILNDYLDAALSQLEGYRLDTALPEPFDDAVFRSIESLLPVRDEFVTLVLSFSRHVDSDDTYAALHSFLESALRFKYPPPSVTSWSEVQFDNYGFLLNELFLYLIAALVRAQRFARARFFMEVGYYVPPELARGREAGVNHFDLLWHFPRSFEIRNRRLNLQRLSVLADTFKARAVRTDVGFERIMEADFVLFLWRIVQMRSTRGWFPSTLLYADRHWHAFEIFERATSRRYFANIRTLLGVDSREDLLARYKEVVGDQSFRHVWQFEGFDPPVLMNAEKLETTP